ncbi:MAG: mannose-6-phosphate isomerase [Candidatus Magasanikbacteria bacterium CG_4_10_14_0_8_um_filter_32_14]|uniref:Mannose-6-phosphate isomerase n=2 Tax=Candidatus Magasanikiibacteriota TaxID=1752731 RepID=A0A2M7RBJ3_9BACT|nr:MAG: mannose-6-phosphate isomerase [Candidatus Magasanikbacteria bacterium CG1_02_32_51]PIY93686.1 MAG: mannose-6-phosphate isomerase [Candidatus Magasanikbacteria bacterium CG_4_10_14_0_8_um_filter_32_14]
MQKYTEERPWGKFEQFCHNEQVTVKIITVKPNSKLSLQYHHKRDEFWRVVGGSGQIVLGKKIIDVNIGDEHYIPKETKHRMIAKDEKLEIMEIAFGEFDENDIVRLEDDYNRK